MLALLLIALLPRPAPGPCLPSETAVVVVAARNRLFLCERGRTVADHRVALGAGGLGKRRAGDGKTPLGRYRLGPPRPSSSFGIFVPVGYPTRPQLAQGFSGSAIGIHGPPLTVPLGAWRNWTAGCIALGRHAEIDAVAAWIRRRRVSEIRIQ
jgi:murein L,D-transpeptidase YafK